MDQERSKSSNAIKGLLLFTAWLAKPDSTRLTVSVLYSLKDEVSTLSGCILRGSHVLVPPPGRRHVLMDFHEGHPGICRMKSFIRLYVWWPRIDKDIENFVHTCEECQKTQPSPPKAPLQFWSWPSRPWSRLHIDYYSSIPSSIHSTIYPSIPSTIHQFPHPSIHPSIHPLIYPSMPSSIR